MVLAQNADISTPATVTATADDYQTQLLAERQRIAAERTNAEAAYADRRKDCYQRFAVNACLTQARDERNARVADLKRQEVSLDDAERKRKGAEKLQRTEDKTSPQVLQEEAQRRGLALQADANRQQRAQDKATKAGETASNDTASSPAARQEKVRPAAKSPKRSNKKVVDPLARKAATTEAKTRYTQRQQEATQHQADVLKRQQESKKPLAAPLQIPSN